MTKRTLASSASPFADKIGFSRAVRVGAYVAVGGTAPIGPDGKTVGAGDPAAQTRCCFEIAEKALNQVGATLDDVVRTRCFLTRIADWEAVGKVHGELFRNIRPASTFMEVKGFINPEWLVEIEVDAIISEDG